MSTQNFELKHLSTHDNIFTNEKAKYLANNVDFPSQPRTQRDTVEVSIIAS